jgi:hypothetical protein
MKVVYLLIFLVVVIITVVLGNKITNMSVNGLTRKTGTTVGQILVSMALMSLTFIGFCVLTQTAFPGRLFFVLILMALFAQVLNALMMAIAGVGTKEKREKTGLLSSFVAYRNSATNPSVASFRWKSFLAEISPA